MVNCVVRGELCTSKSNDGLHELIAKLKQSQTFPSFLNDHRRSRTEQDDAAGGYVHVCEGFVG